MRLFTLAAAAVIFTPLVAAAGLPEWAIGPFTRPVDQPVIRPDPAALFDCPMRGKPIKWEALHTFNPAAVVRDGKVYVLYRAEDDTGQRQIGLHTSRIGIAVSDDGIHFTPEAKPVLFPDADDQKKNEWDGGCEDPRVVESPDGSYVMTYTQWNHSVARLAIATSSDLHVWKKNGPAFEKTGEKKFAASKSAGIVTKLLDDRLVATKIDGKFWMYYGEGAVHLATSENLVDWTPIIDRPGHAKDLVGKRAGKFDGSFPEVGPPAVLTDRGVVLIYNGKNSDNGDKSIGSNAYSGGQVLFDPHDLTKVVDRLDDPFFKPELPFEKTGQYAGGTTFVEGLVHFKGKWFLYYGCADSLVGVASADWVEKPK